MKSNITFYLWFSILLFNIYGFYLFFFINNKVKEIENNYHAIDEDENINKFEKPNENDYSKIDEIRRNIYDDLIDLSFYLKSEFKNLEQSNPNLVTDKQFISIKSNTKTRINFILAQLYNLSTTTGLGEWRSRQHNELNTQVQKQINNLQNPNDCNNNKKLVCDMKTICGFGCQIHHMVYCMITAFNTKRTMHLNVNKWKYNKDGYHVYFQQLNNQCPITNNNISETWTNPLDSTESIIKIPIIDRIRNKKFPYLPPSIPKEFKKKLTHHGNPLAWWNGQLIQYLMRLNEDLEYKIKQFEKKINFKTPCVGIHVRRSDKLQIEAFSYSFESYMEQANEFYDLLDLIEPFKNFKRVVYLTTDDIGVFNETLNYSNYEFIYNADSTKMALPKKRYSSDSFENLLTDIYFMSKCDFFVGTFSSQLGRLIYELMQIKHPDASWRYRSLDSVYHYGGQNVPLKRCILAHNPENENEIELKLGDLIRYYPEKGMKKSSNLWNGYSYGSNIRSKQEGMFPSFKTRDVIQTY